MNKNVKFLHEYIVEVNLQLFSTRLSIYYPKIYQRKIFAKNIYRNYDAHSVPDEGVRVRKSLLSLSGLISRA